MAHWENAVRIFFTNFFRRPLTQRTTEMPDNSQAVQLVHKLKV